ncbi:hypothetical protein QT971_27615 [Microcoleus sp. herbarium19]|uniref:hypothetical protein n=1 Tax=unclassified Microcoleus TaxID=2642155 RepID=UPI002FD1FB75
MPLTPAIDRATGTLGNMLKTAFLQAFDFGVASCRRTLKPDRQIYPQVNKMVHYSFQYKT